tara:strand:+ start:636 stop:902 length:267 start_codon:yes stop_codon:yes gene_type:complete
MHRKNQVGIGISIIVFSLIFLTLKLDCNETKEDIVRLKLKKKIISNNIKSLKVKENRLISKNRIEKIAKETLGMHSPLPESLIVFIND